VLPEAAIKAAIRRTGGLKDFEIENDNWRSNLVSICEYVRRLSITPCGSIFGYEMGLVSALENRLLLKNEINNNPDILREVISKPLFIVGLPRTGSTLLQGMMCQNENVLSLKTYYAWNPAKSKSEAKRICDKFCRNAAWSAPQSSAVHFIDPDGSEECILPLRLSLSGYFYICYTGYGYWLEWAKEQDYTGSYQVYHRVLQLIQWRERKERKLSPEFPLKFVLKAPSHLNALPSLLNAFPDAQIVWTHRDPLKVLPSYCSFVGIFRSMICDDVDAKEIGIKEPQVLAEFMQRGLDSRLRHQKLNPEANTFCDVHYTNLVKSPLKEIKRIYSHFDLPLSQTSLGLIQNYLSTHRQHQFGQHRYSFEQFCMETKTEAKRFSEYVNHFQISEEREG